ncbi:MAG: hypothetical protein OHK0017_06060 [Patescibacteria group bacterium]
MPRLEGENFSNYRTHITGDEDYNSVDIKAGDFWRDLKALTQSFCVMILIPVAVDVSLIHFNPNLATKLANQFQPDSETIDAILDLQN